MRTSVAASLLLALPLGLLGCVAEDAASPPEPAPGTPSTPEPSGPSEPTAPSDRPDSTDGQAGGTSTGMDVRHLNPDGSVSTVEVRDFPR